MNQHPFKKYDAETRKQWCRMGGLEISKDKKHMSEIGRKGGLKVSQDREHMRKIRLRPRNDS